LINNEKIFEQKEYGLYSDFSAKNLKNAAQTLNEYYFCLEETITRIIYYAKINNENFNLIKVLNWKKNNAAIRRYFAKNIISELNYMSWDLSLHTIKTLFDSSEIIVCQLPDKEVPREKLANVAIEFSNCDITDFSELLHNSITYNLETLINNEMIFEQKEFSPHADFSAEALKNAAQILNEYYFCLEETFNRIIYFTNKNYKNSNLIKILNWKKNCAAIRRYFAKNIASEFNDMRWELSLDIIKTLFERNLYFTEDI
jgi:hypothetical protein